MNHILPTFVGLKLVGGDLRPDPTARGDQVSVFVDAVACSIASDERSATGTKRLLPLIVEVPAVTLGNGRSGELEIPIGR
jgi:hypothetical protein